MDQLEQSMVKCATKEDIVPKAGLSIDEHYEKLEKSSSETSIPSESSDSSSLAVAVKSENMLALQQQYISAIIKNKPGMNGEATSQVARDLVLSGIQPTEALMMINLVYGGPNGYLSGRGQATRLKHFSEAITEVWGDRLVNASKHPTLFRGLLARMGEATQLHDDLYQEDESYQISFKDALLYQEVGVDTEYFLSLAESLVSRYHITRVAAKMRIKDAAYLVKLNRVASLENILFPIAPSEHDSEYYEQ